VVISGLAVLNGRDCDSKAESVVGIERRLDCSVVIAAMFAEMLRYCVGVERHMALTVSWKIG